VASKQFSPGTQGLHRPAVRAKPARLPLRGRAAWLAATAGVVLFALAASVWLPRAGEPGSAVAAFAYAGLLLFSGVLAGAVIVALLAYWRYERPRLLFEQQLRAEMQERERTQHALEAALAMHAATLEATAEGIMAVDAAGTVVWHNQQIRHMLGWPADRPLSDFADLAQHLACATAEGRAAAQRLERLLAAPHAETFDLFHLHNGVVLEAASNPQRMQRRAVGRVWSFRDVTTRVRTEEALRASNAFMRSILEAAGDAIITLESDGKIQTFNRAAEQMFGYSAAEIVGASIARLMVPERRAELARQLMAAIAEAEKGTVLPVLGVGLHKEGSQLDIEVSVSIVSGQDGPTYTGIVRDVSARQRAASPRGNWTGRDQQSFSLTLPLHV